MSNWISFHELINRLGAEFEILEYLKRGLQPYSKNSGKPLDCPYFCHMGHDLEDSIKNFLEMLPGEKLSGMFAGSDLDGIKKLFLGWIENWENELIEIKKDDPNYCSWKWLKEDLSDNYWLKENLSDDEWQKLDLPDDAFKELISYLDEAVFRIDDIEKYKIKHELEESVTLVDQDIEDFIKNLKVSYENDYQIKIRLPGRKADCFTCESLGFRDKKTETWKDLINILQFRPHTYDLGAAYKYLFHDVDRSHRLLYSESGETDTKGYKALIKTKDFRVKMYDSKRKRLLGINKKLIKFFHKQYSVKFPKNYKLYELYEENGVYKFKFQIILDDGIRGYFESRYESYSKDQLLQEIQLLAQTYRNKQSDVIMDRFTAAARVALEKEWLSNDEIECIIKG